MKKEVEILTAVSLFYNMGAGLFTPVYALFVRDIGGTAVEAGIAWAIYSIVLGILTMVFGRMEDHKLNKRKMVFFGYIIVAFCSLGYLLIQEPWHLFALQFLIGLGVAILAPAWYALFGLFEDKGAEASEWSLWSGGRSIFMGIAAIGGGFIINTFGWETLFITMFVFQIIAALISVKLLKKEN